MTCNRHWFKIFEETTCRDNIYLGDDKSYQIKAYGDFMVMLNDGNIIYIKNVMYVPGIKKNLIYVLMMVD